MKLSISTAIAVVMFAGCASKPLTPKQTEARQQLETKHFYKADEFEDFRTAIKKQNVEAVRLFYVVHDGIPFDVQGESGDEKGKWILNASDGNAAIIELTLRQPNVGTGVANEAWTSWKPTCPAKRDTLAELLFAKGDNPNRRYYALQSLANAGCTEEFDRYLSRYPEIAHRLYSASDFHILGDTLYDRTNRIEDGQFSIYSKVIASLRRATDAQCESKVLEACRDKETIAKMETGARQKNQAYKDDLNAQKKMQADQNASVAEHDRYETSGEQAIDRACGALGAITMDERNIANEKKVGRTSGSVNLAALNQYGRRLEGSKSFLAAMKAEVLKKTGKPFSPDQCKSRKKRPSEEE